MKIQHDLLPMRDYHMAKDLLWDPRAIALSQDREEWKQRTDDERDSTLTLISLFHAGEEAVTHDLTPLLMALRREGGHLEEQMFLTTQLFEEAKHFEFFDRWFIAGAAVRGTHGTTEFIGRALRLLQNGNLQTYTFLFALGVALVLYLALK